MNTFNSLLPGRARWRPAVVAALASTLWLGANAEPPDAQAVDPGPVLAEAPPLLAEAQQLSSPEAVPDALLGAPVNDGRLADLRGGDSRSTSDQLGTLSGNSATGVVSGNNVISSGSLSGAVGLPMVVQNTGANVLIQNSTIVNVEFK